jgi:putrescine importer
VWPDYLSFPAIETAFLDVCSRVGGAFLFHTMAAILVVACLGSGLAGQVGAARLLFAMGRDGVLPRRLFGYLSPRSASPTRNICFIAGLAFVGGAFLSYERAAELLNFGAFLAFMGVNLATIRRYYFDPARAATRSFWSNLAAPALGFLFCAGIWISLPAPAKIAGGCWLVVGIIYQAIKTRGFRNSPPAIEINSE